MDLHDKHFFVMAAVEDADLTALGQMLADPPQKIVIELVVAGFLEAVDLAARRIDAAHHRLDRPVLPGRVKRLEDHEQSPAVVGQEA